MSDKEKEQKKKYTEKPWAIPKFIAEKAIKDNLSFKAVAVYKWFYDHNNHAKYLDDDPNAIFTKGSLDALYAAIRRDIDVSVRDICMELRGKGWIEPIKNAPLFKGRRQSGFICRLSKEERLLAKAIQQEMEEAAAELVLMMDGGEMYQQDITLQEGEGEGGYETVLKNISLPLPELTEENQLDLVVEITFSDGQSLRSPSAGWYVENGQLLLVAG